MRAVGYHSRLLSGFILGESIAIFLLGGIVGVALSYAVVPILQSVVQSAELDLTSIPLYFSIMIFVGVLVGLIPAIRANNFVPVITNIRDTGHGRGNR